MSTPENRDWRVEPAAPEDAEAIAAVQAKSFRDTYKKADPELNARIDEYADKFLEEERIQLRIQLILRALVNGDEGLYLSAIANDEVVGMLYGFKTDERQEIGALYTDKDYRGQGLGRALVERFIAWSDDSRPVSLGVIADNLKAQGFYRHLGFVDVPDSEHDFPGIEGLKEIRMERKGDAE